MNKTFKIIFAVLLVAGAVVAALSDVPVTEYCGLAVAFASAAALCVATYEKSEKKDWKVKVSIVLVSLGAFGLGFAGVAGDYISKIIAAVGGVVLLIFGIITSLVSEKKTL